MLKEETDPSVRPQKKNPSTTSAIIASIANRMMKPIEHMITGLGTVANQSTPVRTTAVGGIPDAHDVPASFRSCPTAVIQVRKWEPPFSPTAVVEGFVKDWDRPFKRSRVGRQFLPECAPA